MQEKRTSAISKSNSIASTAHDISIYAEYRISSNEIMEQVEIKLTSINEELTNLKKYIESSL